MATRHGGLDKQGSPGDSPHSSPLVQISQRSGPWSSAPQETGVHRPLPALQPLLDSINSVLGGGGA